MSSPRSIARPSARGKQPTPQDDAASSRNLRTITGRVYVASSLSTYDTPRYDRMIDAVRSHLPQATILPARDQFTSNQDWRRCWPDLLPTLDAIVYFEDRDGCVGYGVFTEISDALARGIPVRLLTPDGRLYDIATDDDGEIELAAFHPNDWRQFAQIAYAMPASDALAMLEHDRCASRTRQQVAILQYDLKGGA